MPSNDNRSTAPLSPVEIARLEVLSQQFGNEMDAALRLCHGNAGLAAALMNYENGLLSAEKAIQRIHHVLGLPQPILPSSKERHQLMERLYRAQPLGTASETEAGD